VLVGVYRGTIFLVEQRKVVIYSGCLSMMLDEGGLAAVLAFDGCITMKADLLERDLPDEELEEIEIAEPMVWAMESMARGGYDPRGFITVIERIREIDKNILKAHEQTMTPDQRMRLIQRIKSVSRQNGQGKP